MNTQHKNNHGFTIIEIMVVLIIIGLSMFFGVSGYSRQVRAVQLRSDVERFVDELERARQMTIARDLQGVTTCDFEGYLVSITPSTGVYNFKRRCGGIDVTVLSSKLASVLFPTGVSDIVFTFPYGNATLSQTVKISHSSINQCITIRIPIQGAVSVDDPAPCS